MAVSDEDVEVVKRRAQDAWSNHVSHVIQAARAGSAPTLDDLKRQRELVDEVRKAYAEVRNARDSGGTL